MLKESAPEDEEALLLRQIVFERLNTGGIQLERQEIRNALYQGDFNNLLLELSRHTVIRRAWGLPEYHVDEMSRRDKALSENNFFSKLEDAEVVLRFFALRNAEHYRRGMQGFLDLYMMKAKNFDEKEIAALKALFTDTVSLADAIYGDLVFRPFDVSKDEWSKGPQKAFYDAVMVGLSAFLEHREALISSKSLVVANTRDMFRANEDGTFTGRGNTKADIQNRISLYEAMIRATLV